MDQIWLKMDQKGLQIGLKELRIVHLDQKLLFLVEFGVPLFPPLRKKSSKQYFTFSLANIQTFVNDHHRFITFGHSISHQHLQSFPKVFQLQNDNANIALG